MKKRKTLVEIVRRAQECGSPFLPWLVVEIVGTAASLLLMIPIGLLLGIIGNKLFGQIGGVIGNFTPLLCGLSAWMAIKEKLKD